MSKVASYIEADFLTCKECGVQFNTQEQFYRHQFKTHELSPASSYMTILSYPAITPICLKPRNSKKPTGLDKRTYQGRVYKSLFELKKAKAEILNQYKKWSKQPKKGSDQPKTLIVIRQQKRPNFGKKAVKMNAGLGPELEH